MLMVGVMGSRAVVGLRDQQQYPARNGLAVSVLLP